MGYGEIHVIDLDTIDLTNLNRQFLFREKDIGRYKAEVAASFVSERVPGVSLTWYREPIQSFPPEFFRGFSVIIGGLDNLPARRWMNATLCGFVETDEDGDLDPSTIVPYIDGGTEGFKGQARVILPKITACFECTIDMFPPPVRFPECTIASTPRQPEHCIAYAKEKLWPEHFPGRALDADNPEHMQWIYEQALARAERFGIRGVTLSRTQGVVKNIIPAIASTNALVAALCALEAFKLATYAAHTANNYVMFLGDEGVNARTIPLERKGPGECLACQTKARALTVHPALTLAGLRALLCSDQELQLRDPGLGASGKSLYFPRPPALERQLHANLDKPLSELIASGESTTVSDAILPTGVTISLTVHFDESVALPDPARDSP